MQGSYCVGRDVSTVVFQSEIENLGRGVPRSTIKKIKNLVDPSKTGEIEWFCESQPITNEVKQLWHKAFFHSSTKITILLQV